MVLQYIIFGWVLIFVVAFIIGLFRGTATSIISNIFSNTFVAWALGIIFTSVAIAFVVAFFDGSDFINVNSFGINMFFLWVGLIAAAIFITLYILKDVIFGLFALVFIAIAKLFGVKIGKGFCFKPNTKKYKHTNTYLNTKVVRY